MPQAALYRRIAARLAAALDSGAHLPGERFLSARDLARREGASLPTAVAALRLLEADGRIVARPRSGFFVRSAPLPEPEAAPVSDAPVSVDMADLARSLFSRPARRLVPLGAALPDPDWLPHAALRRALRAAERRLRGEEQSYSTPPGRGELRRQIARRAGLWGASFGPRDVIVVNGATQALRLALEVSCRPGDVVAVESPAYFGALLLLDALGLKAVTVRTDPRAGLDLDDFARVLRRHRPRALLAQPTLHNPLGATMTVEAKRRLVTLAAQAGATLIEDDAYGDLAGEGARPPACKAFDADGGVIYCSSASKTLAPGWRLGWIVAGRRHEEALRRRLAEDWAGAPAPEIALAQFLAGGDYDRHLASLKAHVSRARESVAARVEATFPEGTRLIRPRHGYLLWMELPAPVNALDLHTRALAAGIGVSPGPLFCPARGLTRHLRLNAANEPTPALLNAVARLGALCRDLAAQG